MNVIYVVYIPGMYRGDYLEKCLVLFFPLNRICFSNCYLENMK